MKIVPLAFDSFSTRSMATYVETKDLKIFIDPGISIAPVRYGLPPHPIELIELDKRWEEIVKYAKKSDVLVVSHYHYDHHNPEEHLEIYKNKIVFLKHPTEKINLSQKQRAKYFIEKIKDLPESLEWADGNEFKKGRTKIIFSNPVFHGISPRLGYVIETFVQEGREKFIHTSDVEGPAIKDQASFILEHKPNTVIIDGPLSYIIYRYGTKNVIKSVENLKKILEVSEKVAIDHHFLRELKWKEKVKDLFELAKEKKKIFGSVAEVFGKKEKMLEARRKELWKEKPKAKYQLKAKIPGGENG